MLPRQLRLRRPQDFRNIRCSGRSWANKYLVLSAMPNGLNHNRYGFIVSKQVGHAVTRNLTRRRLRALIQNRLTYHLPGFDLILLARKQSASANYSNLHSDLLELEKRARIVDPQAEGS